jgi:hypothetical protein
MTSCSADAIKHQKSAYQELVYYPRVISTKPGSLKKTQHRIQVNQDQPDGQPHGIKQMVRDLPSGYVNSLLLKMAIYSEFSHEKW